MRDLSLHILDVVQNSIGALATQVDISIEIDWEGWLTLTIKDNGKGMSDDLVKQVKNPFFTTRTTRNIGLGIPLLLENARRSGGDVTVQSTLGIGSLVTAVFDTKNIDCLPIGNMGQTIATLCMGYPKDCEFTFHYQKGDVVVNFDTREVKEVLQEVPLSNPDVVVWIEESINQEIK